MRQGAKSKDRGINPNSALTLEEARKVQAIYTEAYNNMASKVAQQLALGIDTPYWQAKKMYELKRLMTELDAILSEAERKAGKQIDEGMLSTFSQGARAMDKQIKASGYQADYTVPSFSINRRTIETLAKRTKDYLYSKHNIVLMSANRQYVNIVNQAVNMVATGTLTRRQAVTELLYKTPPGATFVDSAGRRMRIDAYARMATRTGFVQANLAGSLQRMDEYGINQVIVSSHAGACPLCMPWENKILDVTN